MALLQNVDPDGLFEYSVVFTDRSLNHMSQNFQSVMRSLSTNLKKVYGTFFWATYFGICFFESF